MSKIQLPPTLRQKKVGNYFEKGGRVWMKGPTVSEEFLFRFANLLFI